MPWEKEFEEWWKISGYTNAAYANYGKKIALEAYLARAEQDENMTEELKSRVASFEAEWGANELNKQYSALVIKCEELAKKFSRLKEVVKKLKQALEEIEE